MLIFSIFVSIDMADNESESEGGGPSLLDFPGIDVVDMSDTSTDILSRTVLGSPPDSMSSPRPGTSAIKPPVRSVPKGSGLAFFMEEETSESESER